MLSLPNRTAFLPPTPARALELFLKDIVLASSRIAQQQNTKKIMPYHIKRLAAQDRTYDFLDDVLAKFVDPTGGAVSGGGGVANSGAGAQGGKGKAKSQARESSDEEEDSDQDQDQDEGEGNGNGNPDRGGSDGSFEE